MAKKTAKKKTTKRTSKPIRSTAKPTKAARGASARRAKRGAPARKAAARPRKPSPVPPGMHTVTPNLVLSGCARAMKFYETAFGAKELMRMMVPGTEQVMHAEMRIGNSVIYVNDAMGGGMRPPGPEHAPTASLALYVENADALFDRAVKAGASVAMPMADMFWGDRAGVVTDPFGHSWMIMTHTRDLTAEEINRGAEEFVRQMSQGAGTGMKTVEAGATHGAPGAEEPPQAGVYS